MKQEHWIKGSKAMNGLAIDTTAARAPLPQQTDATNVLAPPKLREARAHEVSGDGALAFAAMQAGMRLGPVVWIAAPRGEGRMDPYGLAPFVEPSRIILIDAPSEKDAFWAMEEVLRSGAAPTVIGAAGTAPDLTQSRRLQLAAEAGAAAAGKSPAPLAILLTPAGAGGPAAETRWRAAPQPSWFEGLAAPRWSWELIKNKRGPLGAWTIEAPYGRNAAPIFAAQPVDPMRVG
ncbi:MAG: hypothetical protein MRY74_02690 [Neomegalonema sp.]|nr:hypothetical protein [Neomegalonema sp.]